jgi:outer membrane lipoprotein LolB
VIQRLVSCVSGHRLAAKGALPFIAALTLAGCASPLTVPDAPALAVPAAPNVVIQAASIELQGQLSIKLDAAVDQAASGISLGFFFTGDDRSGRLDLMTLMGSQIAQVGWRPDEAWLIDDKGRTPYPSLEALSQETLGEALPLQALVHWMNGRPDPSLNSAATNTGFEQLGWQVDTQQIHQKRLQANRPATAMQRGAHIKVYLDL